MGAVVTPRSGGDATIDAGATRPATLVWIDSREATIIRDHDSRPSVVRVESDVPPHRRATGHIRHDPARHGGGLPQTAGEPRRLEHLKQFLAQVANGLEPDDDLLILGPGTVPERLARLLARDDARHARHRTIVGEASGPLTDRQLMARLRAFTGAETRRQTVGAYRWSALPPQRPADAGPVSPRRVVDKPTRDRAADRS